MSAAPATVLVRGGGVAIATAGRLLANDGFDLARTDTATRAAAPVVMLSEAALALLRDVFDRSDLFAGETAVTRRIVAWGAEPVTLPHAALVMGGEALASALSLSAPLPALPPPLSHDESLFTLDATSRSPDARLRRFGQRGAMAVSVDLAPGADEQTCLVEATSSGWLFLIPAGAGKAWLLGVGDTPDALLGQSRLAARWVDCLGPVTARFETAPRMLENLAGDGWLACGTGAIAFDPICGDGTAQAAREGILAAAVIGGIRAGIDDPAALLGHYHAMLLAAMRRHLQISVQFYRSGGTSPWWREQAEAMAEGYAWCTALLGKMPEPRFLLRGTCLVARAMAA